MFCCFMACCIVCLYACSVLVSRITIEINFGIFVVLDYNECDPSNLVHIKDCDVNANCTNALSTYRCVCKERYYGNGSTCTGDLSSE